METARLEQLGLSVWSEGEERRASLTLRQPLFNPVSRRLLEQITFVVNGERLFPVAPPELVGLPPVLVGLERSASDVEAELAGAFGSAVMHVERRSAELQALGISPQVDPDKLELSAELQEQGLTVKMVADRAGRFRIAQAWRDEEQLTIAGEYTLELSEFRERSALVAYLAALFGELNPGRTETVAPLSPLGYDEVLRAFGPGALVPPRSSLELLMLLDVAGQSYRFAAARVTGRTFRGLLAGPLGKVWADRFELGGFPGVVQLVARLLKVSPEQVKVLESLASDKE
jgi:hypothetical protein